jgi:hypothetical protein
MVKRRPGRVEAGGGAGSRSWGIKSYRVRAASSQVGGAIGILNAARGDQLNQPEQDDRANECSHQASD